MTSPRRRKPKLVKLPVPKGDQAMVDTLLVLLSAAREGRVAGFAMCLIVDDEDDGRILTEASCIRDDGWRGTNELTVMGMLTACQHKMMEKRNSRLGDNDVA